MAELKIISMDKVMPKKVEWLWYPYIPYGKITIIQGDPGEGKTTLVLKLTAMLSKGEALPFDNQRTYPINIIYQTAEDGLNDTIKPRLLSANADCSKIKVIDENDYPLSMADERLEMALLDTGARLLVLDPIQAYIGAEVNMNVANETRSVMARLAKLADKYGCAVVLIGHMNKGNGKTSYRGLGSIDLQAVARSVLIVGRLKDNPQIRIMAHGKSSLAPEGESIGFEFSSQEGINFLGKYNISADDLLATEQTNKKFQTAQKLLDNLLSDGKVLQTEIMEKAKEQGISKRTLDEAKKQTNIKSVKEKNRWVWVKQRD